MQIKIYIGQNQDQLKKIFANTNSQSFGFDFYMIALIYVFRPSEASSELLILLSIVHTFLNIFLALPNVSV